MKKIIGIFIVMLLISTVLPVIGEINYSEEKSKTVNSDHDLYYMFHKFLIRRYYVHLPPDYDGSESMPLVILLHGGDQSPLNFSERCDTNDKADEEGFIAVYPMGLGLSDELRGWNMGFGFRLPYYLNIDDLGFIEKLIGKLQNKYNIDTDRIFIAGYSAGAMMAYYLACNLPQGIVAAYAIVGGAIGGNLEGRDLWVNTKPGHPVSIVIFHGLKDSGLPYYGGWNPENTVFFLSVSDAVDFWVGNNGCNPDPIIEVSESSNITTHRYIEGVGGSEVLLYTIKYGRHCWFGEEWDVRDPYREIYTNDEMWEFFEAHPKQ
jgi:polyhydroxybutyrate depolymerase